MYIETTITLLSASTVYTKMKRLIMQKIGGHFALLLGHS